MSLPFDAYLDIETTGLSFSYDAITVIGVHVSNGVKTRFAQLVGDDITADGLREVLEGAGTIYTYNGSRFDLPFIHRHLGIDLRKSLTHCDLMEHCWRRNLYGGLKSVEKQLGICRIVAGVDGYEAVRLWWRYANDNDEDALKKLLDYNREDVMNLKTLKERLLSR